MTTTTDISTAAAALGRKGGSAKSEAKTTAARRNASLGGTTKITAARVAQYGVYVGRFEQGGTLRNVGKVYHWAKRGLFAIIEADEEAIIGHRYGETEHGQIFDSLSALESALPPVRDWSDKLSGWFSEMEESAA
jgi:hypothetical protein